MTFFSIRKPPKQNPIILSIRQSGAYVKRKTPKNTDLAPLPQWRKVVNFMQLLSETQGRIRAATTAAWDSVKLSAAAIAAGSASAAAIGCKLSLP
jgi:hypothetical protein